MTPLPSERLIPDADATRLDPLESARELADAGRLRRGPRGVRTARRPTTLDRRGLLACSGVVHLAAGRPDDAADAFRKALYLDPDHAEAHRAHDRALRRREGDAAQAGVAPPRLARVDGEEQA